MKQREAESFEYDDEPLHATISLGATELRPADTVESLVTRADAHLYAARQDGRNRVVALASAD